jgi:hypothetical protein
VFVRKLVDDIALKIGGRANDSGVVLGIDVK